VSEAQLRQIAARLGGRAELLDVRLTSSSAELLSMPASEKRLSFDAEVAPGARRAGEGAFVVEVSFTVAIRLESADPVGAGPDTGEGTERENVARLSCGFAALYAVDADGPRDDELDAFARTTGVFALYPYARSWVQDTTARMGLPPLTLPVYRLQLDKA